MKKINIALFLLVCFWSVMCETARAQLGPLPPAQALKRGEEVFNVTCTGMCHGTGGGAGSGAPRLAERGLEGSYIESTVMYGKPGTAMPPWGQKLPLPDLLAVITYVKDLNGIRAISQKAKLSLAPREELGRSLFYDRTGEATHCSMCHNRNGQGLNLAPLKNIPADIQGLRSLDTPNVSTAAVGSETFPALVVMRTAAETKVYDLSTTSPPLRTFPAADIKLSNGSSWKHSLTLAGYTDDELDSILAFLRVEDARGK